MNKLLRIILIVHPFTHYIFFRLESHISKVLALSGIAAVLIVYLCSLRKEKRKMAIPWLWVYVLMQSMFLGLPNYCIHISIFFLLYTTVAQMDIDWEYVFYPLGYVCVAMSLLSIMQKFGICQFRYSYFVSPGLLGNPTDSAMYIAATSPFLLMHKRGWIWFAVPAIAIWMLNSASAVLGILSVVGAYFLFKKYYLRFSLLAGGIFGAFLWFIKYRFYADFFDPHTRLIIWSRAMLDWKEFAWFGRGLGNFVGRYRIDNIAYNMQNHYLYVLYTLGVFGLFLLLLWLLPILKNRKEILPYISVISILVMSTCSMPFRVYPLVLLVGTELGILAHNIETT